MKHSISSRFTFPCLASALFLAFIASASADYKLEKIIVTGDPVPGKNATFERPHGGFTEATERVLNNAGQVAFRWPTLGGYVCTGTPGHLVGIKGSKHTANAVWIDDHGTVVLVKRRQVVYEVRDGRMTKIYKSRRKNYHINVLPSGKIVLLDAAPPARILEIRGNTTFVSGDDIAPGYDTPNPLRFRPMKKRDNDVHHGFLGFCGKMSVSRNGKNLVFFGRVHGPGTHFTPDGIWSVRDGVVELVYLQGDLLLGTQYAERNLDLKRVYVSINSSGTILFLGSHGETPRVLLIDTVGPRVALKEGDPTPGLAGQTLGPFANVRLNDDGQLAFTDPNGLWMGTPEELQLLAPHAIGRRSTQDSPVFASIGDVMLNNNGQVAFWGQPDGGQAGVWIASPSGVQAIVQIGDRIDVGPDDQRTVVGIGFAVKGQSLVGQGTFNDRGEVLLKLEFGRELSVRDPSAGLFLARPSQ